LAEHLAQPMAQGTQQMGPVRPVFPTAA